MNTRSIPATGPRGVPGPGPLVALLVAVFAMSWAGPLVRFAMAPSLVIAAWRLIFSMALIALLLGWRGELSSLARLSRLEWGLALASGALLAGHFWAWIASLEFTTVASSVVLVSTQPLFVAALSAVLLREPPSPRQWIGIAVAVCGAVVLGWGDFGKGPEALYGDALALLGAVLVSGYFVIGRRLRATMDLLAYIGVVYGVAAAMLSLAVLAHPHAALAGHPPTDWAVFAALAVGPMMLGHTAINYALRYVSAYLANLAVLGEPLGATLIAWALPAIAERPGAHTLIGGLLILAGITLGVVPRAGRAFRSGGPS